MSRGNPIVKARIDRKTLDELYVIITEYNFRHPAKPTNVSQFTLKAIREKIAHVKRSNKPKKEQGGDEAEVVNLATGILRDTNTGQEYQCPTR